MGGYILVIPNDSEITSLEILFIKNIFFSEQKRWRCALQGCTQDFQKYHQLCKHLRQDHRPTCEICNQKVKDFKQLRLHMKTHDSNRLLFPCSWEGCDKYFSSVSKHLKIFLKDLK